MLIVDSPEAALRIAAADVRRLALKRFKQVCVGEPYDRDRHGQLIVVEPGDNIEALEEETRWPILHDPFDGTRFGEPDFLPSCDVLEEHVGCYEMVFILNDDGFAVALFIPKQPAIDVDLLTMCALYASPAPDLASS